MRHGKGLGWLVSRLTPEREKTIREQGHYPHYSDVSLLLSEIDALREKLAAIESYGMDLAKQLASLVTRRIDPDE